jgi:mono/diheme cytochrome c family protein
MQTSIGIALIATLAAIALLAAAAGTRPAGAEEAASTGAAAAGEHPDAKMVAEGKALYTHHCAHCHGFNMVNPGTVAYDLRQFPHDQKSRFVNSVTNGKNNRMPRWADLLSPQEIDQLWAYVETGGAQ